MLGKTYVMSLADTPNQRSISAKYKSTEVLGSTRPPRPTLIGAIQREIRIGAKNFPAIHRPAKNEGVRAPGVIGATPVRAQRATEV
jgi:hypothetical protein